MKKGWEYKKLKEVGRTQTGTTPSKSVKSYFGGEIPFIRPAELDVDGNGTIEYNSELKLTLEGALKSRTIKANSTLMCCIGSVGKTGYATKDVTCNQQINTITPYEDYNCKFVYYALLTPLFQNEVIKIANSAKATLPIISKGKWEEMSIPVPPLSEQQSIVDYLDSAFAKIDAMKANAEKALNEAKALFQASLKEMLEPKEGWVTSTLKDECFKITDGTHQTPKYFQTGYIFLSSKNVTTRKIDWINVKFIDESQHQIMHKRVAPKVGDILLAKNGTTGVAAMVDRDVVFDIYVSLALLRSKGNVTSDYLLAFVNSPIAKEQFDKRLIGMGVPNLHLGEINKVVITYPIDKEEQAKVTKKIKELDYQIIRLQENYEKISQECDALKQAILRQVFE